MAGHREMSAAETVPRFVSHAALSQLMHDGVLRKHIATQRAHFAKADRQNREVKMKLFSFRQDVP
jgi:hypothetical protein